MLSYSEARKRVIEIVGRRSTRTSQAGGGAGDSAAERVPLEQALGRVLAEPVIADRDYPPFDRSTRDGFAVRASDVGSVPASLALLGEIRAGELFSGIIRAGECVQIMTGAAMPSGADSVVMVEHASAAEGRVVFERAATAGQNIVPRGSEAKKGQLLLSPGTRLGYAELAIAGQVGHTPVAVHRRPRVAILSTGDEVVSVGATPGPVEIRNSNSVSLAAQAELAGAETVPLGNAPDRADALREMILRGLEADALVLSGGVSMGKYDLVEGVLRELDAEFLFDAVAIRPGRPAVFGYCRNKPVFGLPGNPVSTMVTFELFVVPAIDLLGGAPPRPLALFKARLAAPVKQKAGVTHFLPAEAAWMEGGPQVRELPWQGSGDIVALARANCFLIVPEDRLEWPAGEWVDVLPRRGAF